MSISLNFTETTIFSHYFYINSSSQATCRITVTPWPSFSSPYPIFLHSSSPWKTRQRGLGNISRYIRLCIRAVSLLIESCGLLSELTAQKVKLRQMFARQAGHSCSMPIWSKLGVSLFVLNLFKMFPSPPSPPFIPLQSSPASDQKTLTDSRPIHYGPRKQHMGGSHLCDQGLGQ